MTQARPQVRTGIMTPSSGWEQLLSLVTFHKMPAFKQEQQNAYPVGIACVLDPRVQPHGNSLFSRLFFAASLVGKFKAEGKEQGRLTNGSDFVSFEGKGARFGDIDSRMHARGTVYASLGGRGVVSKLQPLKPLCSGSLGEPRSSREEVICPHPREQNSHNIVTEVGHEGIKTALAETFGGGKAWPRIYHGVTPPTLWPHLPGCADFKMTSERPTTLETSQEQL